MKIIWLCLVAIMLSACSAAPVSSVPQRGHLVNGELIPMIPARVDNPLRVCRSYAVYADLSQPRPLRAYIEDDTGDLCRR